MKESAYFGWENYSDEPTQSYKKFPTQEEWLTGFMGTTLDNCAYCLKPVGTLAINIADVGIYKGLQDDLVEFAESKGWKLMEILKLALSRMMGTRKKQTGTHKYKPIFSIQE